MSNTVSRKVVHTTICVKGCSLTESFRIFRKGEQKMKTKVLAIVAVLGAAVASQAQVLYSTGFESFANGALSGQGGWLTDPGYDVVNNFARTGSKSVRFDTGPAAGSNWGWWDPLTYNPVTNANKILKSTIWIHYNEDNSVADSFFGLDMYSPAVTRVALAQISSAGLVQGSVAAGSITTFAGLTANKNQWNRLDVTLNYNSGLMSVALNGTTSATTLSLASVATTVIDDVDLVSRATGFEVGHFDDLSIQAVPEPGTMAALGLGAAALLRRRKK